MKEIIDIAENLLANITNEDEKYFLMGTLGNLEFTENNKKLLKF